MARRKRIIVKAGDLPYREIVTQGSKRIYRYKVRNILAQKEISRYESLDIAWYKTFVERVIQERKRLGLSQKSLAKGLGTTQAEISRFEHGRANPTVEFLERIISALKVRIFFE